MKSETTGNRRTKNIFWSGAKRPQMVDKSLKFNVRVLPEQREASYPTIVL